MVMQENAIICIKKKMHKEIHYDSWSFDVPGRTGFH